MKKIIVIVIGLFPIFSWAYSPDLKKLGDLPHGVSYVDLKSIQKGQENYSQVVVYDKFSKPVITLDFEGPHQSAIKTYIVNCKNQELAAKNGFFYQGRTSNSEFLGGFNNINSRNGDTGETTTSIYNLDFYTLNELRLKGVENASYITPFYEILLNHVCKY